MLPSILQKKFSTSDYGITTNITIQPKINENLEVEEKIIQQIKFIKITLTNNLLQLHKQILSDSTLLA